MQKIYNKKNIKNGYILGMAMIILGAVLTISLSISSLLLRDFKLSISAINSSTAYGIADSMLSCATALDKNFTYFSTSTSETKKFFSDTNDLVDYYAPLKAKYDLTTIKCLSMPVINTNLVLQNVDPNMSGTTTVPLFTRSNIDTYGTEVVNSETSISQIDINDISSPYRGGVLTKIKIWGDSVPASACGILEVYATSTGERMYIARGKYPCDGNKITERVIVKTLD